MANLALRKELKDIIKKKLNGTLDCQMKHDWFPKGWTCVKISNFSGKLAKEIEIQINRVD